jgi:hypothetical protein
VKIKKMIREMRLNWKWKETNHTKNRLKDGLNL